MAETQAYPADLAAVYEAIFHEFTDNLAPRVFSLYERVAARARGSRATLDLCCGTGAMARYFAERGVDAYGVDASEPMIEAAKAASAALERRPAFTVADARSFTLPSTVLLSSSFYNAMNHFESLDDFAGVTARVLRHTEPGGAFVFDLWTPAMLNRVSGESIRDTADDFQLWRYVPDKARGRSTNAVYGFVRDPGTNQYRRYSLVTVLQTYPLDAVRERMLAQGWASVRFTSYDDLERELPLPGESSIVLVVASTEAAG